MTVTDSDNSPSKHPLASVSVPSLHCIIPYSPSFASLAHSEGDTPHYAPTLVQDPSPTASAIDLPRQSDIIIAYVDPRLKFVSKSQNTAVSWARPERAKVQSVSYALHVIPLDVITDPSP